MIDILMVMLFFSVLPIRGDLNSREEIEFSLDYNPVVEEIFFELNLGRRISYDKLCSIHQFKGCIVCSDNFFCDDYLEVEGEEEEIYKVLNIFGLSGRKTEKRAHHEMIDLHKS